MGVIRALAGRTDGAEGADPYLPGHGDRTFAVVHYDLDLDYRVATNHLDGRAQVEVSAIDDLDRVAFDLAGLDVKKVTVDGRPPAKWSIRAGKLQVRLVEAVEAGESFVVAIRYAGRPGPLRSTWGQVGWEELSDGVVVASQPGGAPTWFPCNDRPDDKAGYRFSVTTDSAYRVVANGVLTSHSSSASRKTWVFEQPQPMATYLATLQIGHYECREIATGPVVQAVIAPAALRAHVDHDFARQPQMMRLFVDRFGPYPFDGYAVVVTDDPLEIPVEAQGISTFGSNHVDGSRGSERLIAHELAHQWFGNSLTLSRWQDIWLHEGFACYAEWLWSEHVGEGSADELARRQHRRLAGLSQDLLLADPGPELMFDDRLYKRGALTLHALRLELGDETFFDLLRDWVAAHRHGSVSTALFVHHLDRYGDGARVVAPWIDEVALPELPDLPDLADLPAPTGVPAHRAPTVQSKPRAQRSRR